MNPNCFVFFMRQPSVATRGDRVKAQEKIFLYLQDPETGNMQGHLEKTPG